MIIPFGKYKNESIEDIFEKDLPYCKWLFNQEMLIGGLLDVQMFLNDKLKGSDLSFEMGWGKWKNRTIKWIQQNEPQYFTWLCKNQYVSESCPALKKALIELS
jgi:uncharacterized protein (DUF3820 family)